MKTCSICNQTFENHAQYANHIRWHHSKTSSTYSPEGLESIRKSINRLNDKRYGPQIIETKSCPRCGNLFKVKYRSRTPKKFCSRSCANVRNHGQSEATKLKLSKAIKEKWLDEEYANKCITAITTNKRFTSKGEVAMRQYFMEKYPEDGWTFGGLLCCNNRV